MKYRVELSKLAEKQIEDLPRKVQERLIEKISSLTKDPRPQGVKSLVGRPNGYRLRVGDYRILYEIRDNELLILVVKLGHRREIYR